MIHHHHHYYGQQLAGPLLQHRCMHVKQSYPVIDAKPESSPN